MPSGPSQDTLDDLDAEDSDNDDARSFGLESDLYGDATIDSTPADVPLTSLTQPSVLHNLKDLTVTSLANNTSLRRGSAMDSEDEVDLVRQPLQDGSKGQANTASGTLPLHAAPRRPTNMDPPLQGRIQEDEDKNGREEIEDSDASHMTETRSDEEVQLNSRDLRHTLNTNTPARHNAHARVRLGGPLPALPRRQMSMGPADAAKSRISSIGTRRANSVPQFGRRESNGHPGEVRASSESASSSHDTSDSGRWLSRATATSNFSSLFAHAKHLAASSSPFGLGRRYPSDESERDAAIGREIDEAEAEVARDRRERAAAEARQRWRQRKDWFTSFLPFSRSSPHETNAIFNLLQLLNPLTYVRALVWLANMMLDAIMRPIHYIIPDDVWDRLSSVFEFLPHVLAGLLAFIFAFVVATQLAGSTDGDWARDVIKNSWRTFDDVRHKVYDFTPRLTWPRRDRWVDIDDLWDNDDAARDKVEAFLSRMEEEFLGLQRARNIHDASLKKLETIVPSIVHMELRDGRPVVSQEFWHAIRDLIHGDGGFLAFDKVGSDFEISSERQWRAIALRLTRDPTVVSKFNTTMAEFESRISGKMANFWDTWVRENDDKITQMLGSAVDQIKSAGSQREFEERLGRIVKEQLSSQAESQRGQVVTREEFLRHLQNEFVAHRSEVKAELEHLQPQLQDMVKQSVQLMSKEMPEGVARADLVSLVNGIVRKALADVNLEALAKGSIHRHWDTELRHQINYFAVGAGAAVDARHSSSTFDPRHEGVVTPAQYEAGYRGPRPFPPVAALDSWQDAGDCWCAARSVNHRGNPHGASLAIHLRQPVVPQHVVIEHILPGATSEPGARPKLIEIWAEFPHQSPEVRDRILDFSAVFFPDDEVADWDFTPPDYPPRFVKISRFVYDGAADAFDGVYVHRLSRELEELGAATDHVIVRAVTNYGAQHHTCFYRVRLYGLNPELAG